MPDIKLYQGETNPADIRLRNPLVAGVPASVNMAGLAATSTVAVAAKGKGQHGAVVSATSLVAVSAKGKGQHGAVVTATGLALAGAQGKGKNSIAGLAAGSSVVVTAYVRPNFAVPGLAATSTVNVGAEGRAAALPGGGNLWGFENPIKAEVRAPGLAARATLAPIKAVGRARDIPIPVAAPVEPYVAPALVPLLAPPPVVVTTPGLALVPTLGAASSVQAVPHARARAGRGSLAAVARVDVQAEGRYNDDAEVAAILLLLREAA